MASKTLKDLMNASEKHTPYPNCSVRVSVLKVGYTATFTGSDGNECQILNFSVGDATEAVLASLNDKAKFAAVKEGKSLLLRNFIFRGGKIILTKNSKLMGSQAQAVPDDVRQRGIHLICPPSPTKAIKEIGTMPRRQLVTVCGQVVKDECMKTVKVGTTDTLIHTIRLKDNGAEIDVSLWRELAKEPIHVGQYIEISQCLTGEWDNKPQLNSTRNTRITQVQVPETELVGEIEGISIGEDTTEMAVNVDGEYKDLITSNGTLYKALDRDEHVPKEEVEEFILATLPLRAIFRMKGVEVTGLRINLNDNDQDTTRAS